MGLVYNATSKTDVKQPEYAVYHWDYYSDSETVGGVAQPANFLKRAYEPNTSTNQPNGTGVFTKYVYNAQNLLAQVLEPNDTGSGTHRAGAFGYNGFGLVASSSDACNRTIQYGYDLLNRPTTITYGDSSTEEFLYGTGEQSHLLAAKKDRNGVVTAYAYDSHSRPIEAVEAVASVGTSTSTGTILSGYTPPNLSSNPALPAVAAVTTWQYLPGTELPTSVTRLGNATNYAYDYRQRLISTGVRPSAGVAPLVSTSSYVNNDLFSEADPYGRKTYYAYQASDGALLRTVQGTLPSFTLSYGSVTTAARPTIPNPNCLIKDYTLDAMDQVLQTTDPRGIVGKAAYDSRGRVTDSYAAYGSAVQAHTQTVYNLNSTVQAVRSPRYFDATDANGQNKASETWTYTNRDLRATHTVAAGDAAYPSGAKATESWTYNADRTVNVHSDFRGNPWQTVWSTCCAGRVSYTEDPQVTTAAGASQAVHNFTYDFAGSVTRRQNLAGANTYNETDATFDARRRPLEQDVAAAIDGNNNVTKKLATQWLYCDDMSNHASGLASAAGAAYTSAKTGANYNVSILALISSANQTLTAAGLPALTFNSTAGTAAAAGSAVAVINPLDEISVTVRDAIGRTVISGIIKPNGTPITWQVAYYAGQADTSGATSGLVQTVQIDALGHANTAWTDGAGRTIQSADALGKITSLQFDANGNMVSVRDPNSVGWDAGTALGTYNGYDALNRLTDRTDTQGDSTKTVYDLNGNVVQTFDAKNYVSRAVSTKMAYDARDRKVSMTDRNGGLTTWGYDPNSNLLTLCDPDNQGASPPATAKPTVWIYDPRNQKSSEQYPDHVAGTTAGQAGYDLKIFAYDPVGRPQVFNDQKGDTVTYIFDAANRLLDRDYRTAANSPSGTIADSDVLAYDDAGRLLTAASGRYNNTVSLAYTDGAGRLTSETLAFSGSGTTELDGDLYRGQPV